MLDKCQTKLHHLSCNTHKYLHPLLISNRNTIYPVYNLCSCKCHILNVMKNRTTFVLGYRYTHKYYLISTSSCNQSWHEIKKNGKYVLETFLFPSDLKYFLKCFLEHLAWYKAYIISTDSVLIAFLK